jgi:hypothetical protein
MPIGDFSIDGYWLFFLLRLLVAILLMVIGSYCIGGY